MVLRLKLIPSILAAIADKIDSFKDHYYGPEYRWAIEDMDNWLRWQCKADKILNAQDVRDRLWEIINDRGVYIP